MKGSARFLKRFGWQDAGVEHLKGDLSSRRFTRLTRQGQSAVLMQFAAGNEGVARRVVDVTRRLEAVGLSVPRILECDIEAGAFLIEDFGDRHLARMIETSSDPKTLLTLATEALAKVRDCDIRGLSRLTARELAEMTALTDDWLPGSDPQAGAKLRDRLASHLREILDVSPVLALRDYHVENILFLPERSGIARIGLIDFQDAFATHPLYDVASLLRDARIDIDPDLALRLLDLTAGEIGLSVAEARRAFDVLSFQRNLRILAVFHRAARRDGKTMHLRHVPRVRTHVERAAENPALSDLADLLPRVLTPEAAGA